MDLTEISREQAVADLGIANARILELSVEVRRAGEELQQLRRQLNLREKKASSRCSSGEPLYAVERASAGRMSADAPKKLLVEQLKRLLGVRPRLIFSLDEVCGRAPVLSKNGARATVMRSEFRFCTLRGWALPENASSPFASLEVVVSGEKREVRRAATFQTREDVAKHFGDSALASAGFLVEIPMSELAAGTYEVKLVGQSGSGDKPQARVLEVEIR